MENKPFFAKYIAVEGEIKNESLVLDKDRNKIGRITYPDNADGIYHVDFLDGTSGGCDHFVPVKLFLCSRDIQVGDKAFITDHPELERLVVEGIGLEYDCPTMNPCNDGFGFKVIGEISPEARFVKEGDEFSAGEFCYRQFGNGRIYLEQPEWFNYIAVKCPCCGDFK